MDEPRNVIVVARIAGGLGNQLFGYAAARRLALKNDADLVLDTISGFAYDSVYKRSFQLVNFSCNYREATARERLEPFSKVRRYLMRVMNKYKKGNRKFFTDYTNSFDSSILSVRFNDNVYIEGYWQDERYFKDCEALIRRDLKIKPPTDELNLRMLKSIKSHISIAIHVRFFFDPDTGKDIGTNYYNAAIKEMERKFGNAHYFLFSDKPNEAEKKINIPSDRLTIVNHNLGDENSYADLWLMSLCNHFIIANSTFSWWGAWLSEGDSKYVIAPDYKIHGGGNAAKVFSRMILKEWNQL